MVTKVHQYLGHELRYVIGVSLNVGTQAKYTSMSLYKVLRWDTF